MDVQSASGGFFLEMAEGGALRYANYIRNTASSTLVLTFSFFSRYEGLQNVVARALSGASMEGHPMAQAVLVNCHFDSVPLSPGASDDAVQCGIMLEVLRALSASLELMANDVLFLFNGAEETPLPASHAFITQVWIF